FSGCVHRYRSLCQYSDDSDSWSSTGSDRYYAYCYCSRDQQGAGFMIVVTNRRGKSRGSATLEMTLVGIPIIFVLISVAEMARGMWIYHTLAYSIREGTRYASVHGRDCSIGGNTCSVTVGQIAAVIKNAAIGLDPADLKVQMKSLTDDTGLLS